MPTKAAFPQGAVPASTGTEFSVYSRDATKIELCLFETDGNTETARLAMQPVGNGIHRLTVPQAKVGTRYGYRAHGSYTPEQGLWFDPTKLLLDPYATTIDRPFENHPSLFTFGEDTASIMPKAIVSSDAPVSLTPPRFTRGGLIYEVAVKPFTMLHPDVPDATRGTVAALAHPAIIGHLQKIGVSAVELMPITAWIDERHLPPLGLTNGWGYNPVGFMALDPRLCPGGMKELRDTVAALHAADIGVILDLVFNHTGESDRFGSTLSLRGLDNRTYYRHLPNDPGTLINDTGTGNTLACDHPQVRHLVIETLRHFVSQAGVDGFRFDLAPVLGRGPEGFDPHSETLRQMHEDPLLADRILIAEPWDIGPGGYQLGNFPASFLEWNDRARDDIRRYWHGDDHTIGALADALAGSAPLFSRNEQTETRSVNFIAAHDGFTLFDLVSHAHKHNEANGEDNRDGHNDNHSWNNGIEGLTGDAAVNAARIADIKALLATLFVTRGTVMLTAGDEGGRSQRGNNNAYAQDNAITWVDWTALSPDLIDHTTFLAKLRQRFSALGESTFFSPDSGEIEWLSPLGEPMCEEDWNRPDATTFAMVLRTLDKETGKTVRLATLFNRSRNAIPFTLKGEGWRPLGVDFGVPAWLPPRSVVFYLGD
ncbi:glycogen debranching protein GlgX [uncultured Agrobacterium sp.]|uniref:glycogen debranching protein GlgX n=1 Tax=uncultured Agrobacterium sp. TaxID=157277 RepID=UPI0025F196D0|nr:glycogen debranching protein GlgX [uncultured Agrobacterium sp.]